jgi:CheY-like chemotaxis protein/anti-sigma regulatory factor (Ser/Thr protein kinase)
MFAHAAESKGVELVAHYAQHDATLTRMRGDPLRLRQVLANLVGNAVKFTERGQVRVHVTRRAVQGRIAMEIVVEDTGIGIDASAQSGIFESFSQADGSTTRRYGGTGLGLAICRRLLTLMGGSIRVDSEPGAGSRFVIALSLPEPQIPYERLVDARPLAGRSVLVVDDNRASRTMLRELLTAYGMDVVTADGGRAALELLRQSAGDPARPLQMAVIDLGMPQMDGLQLVAAMRALPAAATLPVMLLTSPITSVDDQQLQRLGIRHHINKPVRREEMLLALCAMLGIQARLPISQPRPRGKVVHPRLRGTALVVEDNRTNQKVATAMLAALGVHSVLAENGQIAVDKVREQPFDLVLMDCQMPVMDGYAATAAIRALPAPRNRIPVIALTANALQGDEAKCMAAGMDGFLPKPLTLDHLATALGAWLPVAEVAPDPAASAIAPAPGTINMHQLATLQQIGTQAGTDLVAEVLRDFLEEADQHLPRLQQAIDAGDAKSLSRGAHALKSSTANLGAESLSALYRRLEAMGRNSQFDDARALLAELRGVHDDVVRRAHEILREAA